MIIARIVIEVEIKEDGEQTVNTQIDSGDLGDDLPPFIITMGALKMTDSIVEQIYGEII